jgi:energy-coupling factor transport system permease protein
MYRRRPTALHAARAWVAAAYGLGLVALALCSTNPILLAGVACAVVCAGHAAGAAPDMRAAGRLAIPLALLLAVINGLVVRDGLTVVASLGEVPPFGFVDVTREALVAGLLIALRVVVVILAFVLLTATVDPDAVLRGLRRVSFRSALTAVLTTRMVPVLARDAGRMDLALRARGQVDRSRVATRVAVVRAVTANALDRAVDVAATLELRGYATRRRPARGPSTPWSRHDTSVLVSAAGLWGLAALVLATGVADVASYPLTRIAAGPGVVLAALLTVALALLPFASRRGVDGR